MQAGAETITRPLFVPGRRPAPVATAEAGAMKRGQFLLQGTALVDSIHIAFLKEVGSGTVHRVAKGEEIKGMKLTEVSAEKVVLKVGDDAETLPLVVAKTAGAPAAAGERGPFAGPETPAKAPAFANARRRPREARLRPPPRPNRPKPAAASARRTPAARGSPDARGDRGPPRQPAHADAASSRTRRLRARNLKIDCARMSPPAHHPAAPETGETLSWHRRHGFRLAAVALALVASSCSLLPGAKPDAPGEAPSANETQAEQAPAPAAAAPKATAVMDQPRVFPGTGTFVNTAPAKADKKAGPEEASLNFEALDVRSAAKVILGDYLRESYTVHPGVTGTVTFRTIKPIPKSALLPTLEMLLRQNNAAVVKEDGIFKVLPIAAVRGSVSPQLGGAAVPLPQGYSVVVVPLKFVGAKEMAKLLEPFAADNTVRVDDVRNLVILAGNQKEMRHLLDTIELFDVDWLSGFSIGIFPVRSADVKALVADLDKVFGAAGSSPLAGLVRVIPIERLNSLLIVTTQPRYLEKARTWMERLDQIGGTSGGSRLFVYAVRNGKAENLANLVTELFTKRTTTTVSPPQLAPGLRPGQIGSSPALGSSTGTSVTTAAQPAASSLPSAAAFALPGAVTSVSSEVRVIADKDNNALLILATPSDYEIIESALVKLDVIPKQVLVEVTVAEVTLSDDLKFGVDWFLTAHTRGDGSITSGASQHGRAALHARPARCRRSRACS